MTITMPYLRKERTRQFIPPSELAKLAEVSVMTVWRLERGGATRMMTVRKLAKALGVKPGELAVIHKEKEPTR
jgi:transcriptional regulator with XRE-family HTH domain